jgi:hypothetical protein
VMSCGDSSIRLLAGAAVSASPAHAFMFTQEGARRW